MKTSKEIIELSKTWLEEHIGNNKFTKNYVVNAGNPVGDYKSSYIYIDILEDNITAEIRKRNLKFSIWFEAGITQLEATEEIDTFISLLQSSDTGLGVFSSIIEFNVDKYDYTAELPVMSIITIAGAHAMTQKDKIY